MNCKKRLYSLVVYVQGSAYYMVDSLFYCLSSELRSNDTRTAKWPTKSRKGRVQERDSQTPSIVCDIGVGLRVCLFLDYQLDAIGIQQNWSLTKAILRCFPSCTDWIHSLRFTTTEQAKYWTFCWRSWRPCILYLFFVVLMRLARFDLSLYVLNVCACVIYGTARPNEIKHNHRRDDDRQLYDETKCVYSCIWLSAFAQTHTATNELHTAVLWQHTTHTQHIKWKSNLKSL